jgi:hypothetical protein
MAHHFNLYIHSTVSDLADRVERILTRLPSLHCQWKGRHFDVHLDVLRHGRLQPGLPYPKLDSATTSDDEEEEAEQPIVEELAPVCIVPQRATWHPRRLRPNLHPNYSFRRSRDDGDNGMLRAAGTTTRAAQQIHLLSGRDFQL